MSDLNTLQQKFNAIVDRTESGKHFNVPVSDVTGVVDKSFASTRLKQVFLQFVDAPQEAIDSAVGIQGPQRLVQDENAHPSAVGYNATAMANPYLPWLVDDAEIYPFRDAWMAESNFHVSIRGESEVRAAPSGMDLGPDGYKVEHSVSAEFSYRSKQSDDAFGARNKVGIFSSKMDLPENTGGTFELPEVNISRFAEQVSLEGVLSDFENQEIPFDVTDPENIRHRPLDVEITAEGHNKGMIEGEINHTVIVYVPEEDMDFYKKAHTGEIYTLDFKGTAVALNPGQEVPAEQSDIKAYVGFSDIHVQLMADNILNSISVGATKDIALASRQDKESIMASQGAVNLLSEGKGTVLAATGKVTPELERYTKRILDDEYDGASWAINAQLLQDRVAMNPTAQDKTMALAGRSAAGEKLDKTSGAMLQVGLNSQGANLDVDGVAGNLTRTAAAAKLDSPTFAEDTMIAKLPDNLEQRGASIAKATGPTSSM
ncbi:MAG: hypothetical protein H6867_05950 [Rhodospirillales bacterium]|nr:hypothetical protein [Rhodospirillales bacterium]MCB9995071.1 hypothetical protein [Rhodospirillales bacterium]